MQAVRGIAQECNHFVSVSWLQKTPALAFAGPAEQAALMQPR